MPHDLNSTERAINANNLPLLHQQYGGPVWVYEAEMIVQQIEQLRHFDVIRFAQKACSNIHILRLMRSHGVKVDSVKPLLEDHYVSPVMFLPRHLVVMF